MLYKTISLLSLLVICALCVLSCKKKKGLNLSNIKIATVDFHESDGHGYKYRITYDTYGNVDSIIANGTGAAAGDDPISKFTYLGSSFRITNKMGESYFVYANTAGMILEVQKYDTMLMTYNGTQLDELDYKLPTSTPPYYTINAYTYQWSNGDIATFGLLHGAADTFSYNDSRSGQVGDALRIDDFLVYGRPYKLTSHLPVEHKYTNGKQQYFYTFDGSGRISTFTRVISGSGAPNDTSEYTYTYY